MSKTTAIANVTKTVKAAGRKVTDATADKLAQARAEVRELRKKREAEAAEREAMLAQQRALEQQIADAQKPVLCSADKPEFTPEQEEAARHARVMAAAEAFLGEFQLPSWKRVVCGVVLGGLLAFGTGYVIGTIAAVVIAGVVALTGLAWLGWVIYALALVISMWAGAKVGMSGFNYVASFKVDDHASALKNKVLGLFKSKPVVEFNGAHVVA